MSAHLAALDDLALAALLDRATPLGAGIGGGTGVIEVAGVPVFAKRVPLTDLERRPANVGSTANLFGLPTFYQYGIGSAGFGAWREVAAHTMTTGWVLRGDCPNFPLLYHWRALPVPAGGDRHDVDDAVAYWAGSPAVRARLAAIEAATASVVLFLEYVPHTVTEWFGTRLAEGNEAFDEACALVARELDTGIAFLSARGVLHFDAHFENILTDGRRLYFADFGLAASSRFEVTPAEAEFFAAHSGYDRYYTANQLVIWVATALGAGADRDALVREHAGGGNPLGLPPSAEAIVRRQAPVAVVMTEFARTLARVSRTTPYPARELARAWAGTDN